MRTIQENDVLIISYNNCEIRAKVLTIKNDDLTLYVPGSSKPRKVTLQDLFLKYNTIIDPKYLKNCSICNIIITPVEPGKKLYTGQLVCEECFYKNPICWKCGTTKGIFIKAQKEYTCICEDCVRDYNQYKYLDGFCRYCLEPDIYGNSCYDCEKKKEDRKQEKFLKKCSIYYDHIHHCIENDIERNPLQPKIIEHWWDLDELLEDLKFTGE